MNVINSAFREYVKIFFWNLVKRITSWNHEKQHGGVDNSGQKIVQFEVISGDWRGLEDAPGDGGAVIHKDEGDQLDEWVDLKYNQPSNFKFAFKTFKNYVFNCPGLLFPRNFKIYYHKKSLSCKINFNLSNHALLAL